jgi:arylsulfatase A-like enzyme
MSLYAPLLHVPLIIRHPSRAPAGERISQPVSLRNLAATILDLAGLRQQRILPGTSLTRFWEAGRADRDGADVPAFSEVNPPSYALPKHYPITKGSMKSLVWRDYHYIRNGDSSEELYHVEDDPGELQNLAGLTAVRAVLDRSRALLDADCLS